MTRRTVYLLLRDPGNDASVVYASHDEIAVCRWMERMQRADETCGWWVDTCVLGDPTLITMLEDAAYEGTML